MAYTFAAFATFPDRASAQLAIVDLADFGLQQAVVKLFECPTESSRQTILDCLMSNGTWAESDGRRGMTIGILLGATFGCICGSLVWSWLDMSGVGGGIFGVFMGTLFGASMTGIVGAGLVNPRLAGVVRSLQPGQVLVSLSCRTEREHRMAIRLLRTGSLGVGTDRVRRSVEGALRDVG